MCTYLYNFTFIQNYNLVGIANSGKAVCHYYNCFSLVELREVFCNGSFIVGIEGIGRFIQEDEHWILIDYPCNKDALSLPFLYKTEKKSSQK